MRVTHIWFIGNDNNTNSTSVYWNILFPYHNPTIHVPMLGLKDVFKTPLIKWCICLQLRYEFPSVSHKILHQTYTQLSLTLKETVFSLVFKPSTTSLPFNGSPTSLSIMMLYACDNIYNKYSAVTYQYCSAQPSIFSHIVLMSAKNTVCF